MKSVNNMNLYAVALLLPFVLASSYSSCQCITYNGDVYEDSQFDSTGCTGGPTTYDCPDDIDFGSFAGVCNAIPVADATCCIDNTYNELDCYGDDTVCGTYCS